MELFTERELIALERNFDRYEDTGSGTTHTFFRLIDYVRRTALEPIKPFPGKSSKRLPGKSSKRLPNVAQS